MSSNYWSSTTNANNNNNAWIVNFNNGNINNNNKSNNNYVRAVRAGKCELFSFASVYRAYLDCRKRKRGTINALRFEYDLLENLMRLALEIQQGTYKPSRSVCFVTTSPKLREIFAADFRDRIVHHLIIRELEKIWEPKFIYDSFASRKGKGTHEAVRRLQGFLLQATRSGKKPAWYMQLDIRSFFMSIDKSILFALLEKILVQAAMADAKRFGLLYLLENVIFHDCTADYCFKGDPKMLQQVPPHKSLFTAGPGRGLPIGNLTSQFFANVYLHELDRFVKHSLHCRYYVRYVDDVVLVSDREEQLSVWREQIRDFLSRALLLQIKGAGIIRRVSAGADFLGYIVRPGYLLARRRVVNNLKARLSAFRKQFLTDVRIDGHEYCRCLINKDITAKLRQIIASYLGHFRHAATFRLVQSLPQKQDWLSLYFYIVNGVLHERFRYRGVFRSLRMQTHFFRQRLAGMALPLIQVGKYYELYDEDARQVLKATGLRLLLLRRRGFDFVAGFPARLRDYYVRKILAAGCSLAVFEETGPGQFVAQRYISEIYQTGVGVGCAGNFGAQTKTPFAHPTDG